MDEWLRLACTCHGKSEVFKFSGQRNHQIAHKPSIFGKYRCVHNVFTKKCSRGCNYIGRTDRLLRTRVAEHILKWVVEAMNTSGFSENMKDRRPASSIARHLIGCGHKVEPNTAFSSLHRNSKDKLLRFIEALATPYYAFINNLFSPFNYLSSLGTYLSILMNCKLVRVFWTLTLLCLLTFTYDQSVQNVFHGCIMQRTSSHCLIQNDKGI